MKAWSRKTKGLWIVTGNAKVRHLWIGTFVGKTTECSRRLHGRIVNGAEYDRLAPCSQCVATIRQRAAYWAEALDQQDGAA